MMEYVELPLTKRKFDMLAYTGEDKIQEGIRILKRYIKKDLTEFDLRQVRMVVVRLNISYRKRWHAAGSKKDRFEKNNGSWLDTSFTVPSNLLRSEEEEEKRAAARANRTLPYKEKGIRSKQREIAKISDAQSENMETEALLKATSRTMRKRGHTDIADLIAEMTKSPERPAEMKRKVFDRPKPQKPFNALEALTLLCDLSLTAEQYKGLRCYLKERGYKDLFPSYTLVERATPRSQPPLPKGRKIVVETVTTSQVSELNSVDLQNSMDHDHQVPDDDFQFQNSSVGSGNGENPLEQSRDSTRLGAVPLRNSIDQTCQDQLQNSTDHTETSRASLENTMNSRSHSQHFLDQATRDQIQNSLDYMSGNPLEFLMCHESSI